MRLFFSAALLLSVTFFFACKTGEETTQTNETFTITPDKTEISLPYLHENGDSCVTLKFSGKFIGKEYAGERPVLSKFLLDKSTNGINLKVQKIKNEKGQENLDLLEISKYGKKIWGDYGSRHISFIRCPVLEIKKTKEEKNLDGSVTATITIKAQYYDKTINLEHKATSAINKKDDLLNKDEIVEESVLFLKKIEEIQNNASMAYLIIRVDSGKPEFCMLKLVINKKFKLEAPGYFGPAYNRVHEGL